MNNKINMKRGILAILLVLGLIWGVSAISSSINIDVIETRQLSIDFIPVDERKKKF